MSGISEIYNSDNQHALTSGVTFSDMFDADIEQAKPLLAVPAAQAFAQIDKMTQDASSEQKTVYLLGLLENYHQNFAHKIAGATTAAPFNLPLFASQLASNLQAEPDAFWQRDLISVKEAIVIADCLHHEQARLDALQPVAEVVKRTKPAGSGRKRAPFDLTQIDNPVMRQVAAAWNDQENAAVLADRMHITPTILHNTLHLLRDDPSYVAKFAKNAAIISKPDVPQPNLKVPPVVHLQTPRSNIDGRPSRTPIPDDIRVQITDKISRRFAYDWDKGMDAHLMAQKYIMPDCLPPVPQGMIDKYGEDRAEVNWIVYHLRRNPDLIIDRDMNFHQFGRPNRRRRLIPEWIVNRIADPTARRFADEWNEGVPTKKLHRFYEPRGEMPVPTIKQKRRYRSRTIAEIHLLVYELRMNPYMRMFYKGSRQDVDVATKQPVRPETPVVDNQYGRPRLVYVRK